VTLTPCIQRQPTSPEGEEDTLHCDHRPAQSIGPLLRRFVVLSFWFACYVTLRKSKANGDAYATRPVSAGGVPSKLACEGGERGPLPLALQSDSNSHLSPPHKPTVSAARTCPFAVRVSVSEARRDALRHSSSGRGRRSQQAGLRGR
jgi:hypothetical protein